MQDQMEYTSPTTFFFQCKTFCFLVTVAYNPHLLALHS